MTRLCWLFLVLSLRSSFLLGSYIPRQEKQVVFCAGQNKSLECLSPGSTIAIMDAFWGRLSDKICPSEDGDPNTSCGNDLSTTPLLRKICDDKVYCEIPARHTVLQKPGTVHCPGVNKYLIVNYTCVPVEHKLVLCDGETTNLQCREDWKLNVIEAFWGRVSPTTCAATLGHPSRIGKCKSLNSTLNTVRQLCQGNRNCVIRADAAHMTRGADHCPDVDKYAIIQYKCQPNVILRQETTPPVFGSTKNSFTKIDTNKQKSYRPILQHVPTILQTAKSDSSSSEIPSSKATTSIDSLLEEYMNSQKSTGEKEVELHLPKDATPSPPPKEQISVPQDSSEVDLQQDIDMIKKILRSKDLMKIGIKAFRGINEASAKTNSKFSKDEAAKNVNTELHLSLSDDDLRYLARSPDAIKIINELIDREKLDKSDKDNGTNVVAQNITQAVFVTPLPSVIEKPSPTKLPIKDLDPTAKLGGKIMGNLLYEKFLKPTQDQQEEQPTPSAITMKGNQISVLKEKISALQAISDALKLITSKLDSAEKRVSGPHFDVGTLEVSEDVNQKDVKYLQDKINRAIETTEEMGRKESLKLRRKALQETAGTARDNVLEAKEKLQMDKQIKDIEDTFNDFIKRAERSGKFRALKESPTASLFQQMQSGAFKMNFNDDKSKKVKNDPPGKKEETNPKYGFKVESKDPIINIVNEKVTNVNSKTSQASISQTPQTSSTIQTIAEKKPEIQSVSTIAQKLTKLSPKTVTKAVNSTTNTVKRLGNATYSISLKPITTYDDLQKDVTLGGRINSEIIKEKAEKEKLYHGKDIKALLKNLKPNPTSAAPSFNIKLINDVDKSKGLENVPSVNITVLNDTKLIDEKQSTSAVKTVGKLDENTVKLLSIVVQGYLNKSKKRRKKKVRRRKKKGHKAPITIEQEDITIGAKHNQVSAKESKKELDGELLDMLEDQLINSQTMSNIENNAEENDFSAPENMKSLPNDREDEPDQDEEAEGDLSDGLFHERKKPVPAPSDHDDQPIEQYTSRTRSINNLVRELEEMIKEGTKDGSEFHPPSLEAKQKTNPYLSSTTSSQAHFIHFSGAKTSGKILDLDDQANRFTKGFPKGPQTFLAGGRIAEEGKSILKPVSQAALAAINLTPTTKSSVGTTPSSRSRMRLKKLVNGVKRLLKALRGSISRDSHHKNENDKNGNDKNENDKNGNDKNDDDEYRNKENTKDNDSVYRDLARQSLNNLNFQPKNNYRYNDHMIQGGDDLERGYKPFERPYKPNYDLGEQYDMNLARQYATNPKEYSSFAADRYTAPFVGYPMQPQASYTGFVPNQVSPYSEPLPKKAKHALTSALTNDPIIQAVEEFTNNESKLYNERLQGIQRSAIPHPHRKSS